MYSNEWDALRTLTAGAWKDKVCLTAHQAVARVRRAERGVAFWACALCPWVVQPAMRADGMGGMRYGETGIWDVGYGCWGYGIWGMRDEPIWASGQGGGWRGRNEISLLKPWLLRAYTPKGLGAPLAKCTRLADAECSICAYTPPPPPSEPPDTSLVPWPCEPYFLAM